MNRHRTSSQGKLPPIEVKILRSMGLPFHTIINNRMSYITDNKITICRYVALVGESAQRPEEDGAIDGIRDRKDVDVWDVRMKILYRWAGDVASYTSGAYSPCHI
ncbi:hypothetical protein K470DRAFT_117674 [Piedraia hortae CBS 480.64]|uniref:Uncharacterized protein n=1 Tax=Piedraia hortae CBS 480.64 TaxID=1314780 RepID=A0A6A7BUI1_9PEZI|nr:hypothetical protein K470DRAFT_117674 [Piedraia hortae CBS 480.64]